MTGDRARELEQLGIWAEFVGEIDKLIAAESSKFLSCTPDQLNRLQERVRAFEFVKALPGHISDRES